MMKNGKEFCGLVGSRGNIFSDTSESASLFFGMVRVNGENGSKQIMGKRQAENQPFQPSDYNEPTEPLEPLVLPQYYPAYAGEGASPLAPTVPTPPLHLPPVASVAQPVYPYPQPAQAAYPVLPPAPARKHRGYPPGGASPAYQPWSARRQRKSPWPGLVRFFFVLVQLVLLTRVVCLLFGVQNTAAWLTLLFAAGDFFVLPMRWLAESINLPVLAGTQLLIYLEFLVAILAYGLFSRLLTLLLRALLN
jgi:hypothetical protein